MEVVWSSECKISYFKELDFVYEKWNEQEVENFILLVEEFVERIERGILQGKTLHNKNLKSFVISKQTTVFFDYCEDEKIIELLLFWNNSQNPKSLKMFINNLG